MDFPVFSDFQANITTSWSGRIPLWKSIIKEIIPLKWFSGWGLGQFKILYPTLCKEAITNPLIGSKSIQAHNEYLQLFVEMGIVGVTIAFGYITSILVKAYKQSKLLFICFVTVLLNCIPNFLLHTTSGIIFLVYAMVIEKDNGRAICQQ